MDGSLGEAPAQPRGDGERKSLGWKLGSGTDVRNQKEDQPPGPDALKLAVAPCLEAVSAAARVYSPASGTRSSLNRAAAAYNRGFVGV